VRTVVGEGSRNGRNYASRTCAGTPAFVRYGEDSDIAPVALIDELVRESTERDPPHHHVRVDARYR
jgi:hypothetical protein